MPNVIKQIGNVLAPVLTGANDILNNAIPQVGRNLNDLGDNTAALGNDFGKFVRDVNGTTARNAASSAADEAAQAQMDAEAAARHQARLTENSADFKRQRDAQQIKQLIAGGRTGTLMNGTTGYTSGTGETTGGPTGGSKTLMGK